MVAPIRQSTRQGLIPRPAGSVALPTQTSLQAHDPGWFTHSKSRMFGLLDAPPAHNPGLARLMAVKPVWKAKTGRA